MQAWIRGKQRGKSEYEDEIVSAIFGPLQYLPSNQRLAIVNALAKWVGFESEFDRCEILLWPRWSAVGGGTCEPDLVIKLTSEKTGDDAAIVIEAKWDSVQGNDQLARQWKAAKSMYKSKYESDNIRHIFLTKHPKSLNEMLWKNIDEDHSKFLSSKTWAGLASVLQSIECRGEGERWADDVRAFLKVIKQAPFRGFETPLKNSADMLSVNGKWKFRPKLMQLQDLIERHGIVDSSGDRWIFHNDE